MLYAKIAGMKIVKILGIVVLVLLAVGVGIGARLWRDKNTVTVTPPVAAVAQDTPVSVVANPLAAKQAEAFTAWMAKLPGDIGDDLIVARDVLSLNYRAPLPSPPYLTDVACGLYIIDSTLPRLAPSEQQGFADAFNLVYDDGVARTLDDLFGLQQKFRPTAAASALEQYFINGAQGVLSPTALVAAQENLAKVSHSTSVTQNPTGADCELIPDVPAIFKQ